MGAFGDNQGVGPLGTVRVLDLSTLIAGPTIATLLGDFGADVIKVEHPKGDPLRKMAHRGGGDSAWWSVINRNKRCMTLDLSSAAGQRILKSLAAEADVLIENFRPDTMERWGLGYDELSRINPQMVMARVTGFGQTGDYRRRPGYGTLAEAMSGFAHANGYPDGAPTLPPFALADGVAGLFGTFSCLMALHARNSGAAPGGQVIDIGIVEALFWILGPQATAFQRTGEIPSRTGNRAPFTAPRNLYQAADGTWLALSASSQAVAERVVRLVGRADLVDEPWFAGHSGRVERIDLLDKVIGDWIAARSAGEVIEEFERHEAAIAPVYSIQDILRDPQFLAREMVVPVSAEGTGPVLMQGVVPKLSETPGAIRFPGPARGQHTEDILAAIGYRPGEVAELRTQRVI